MSLIREAANNSRVPEIAQDLRASFGEIIDTYGTEVPYGHDLPKGFRGTARFLRSIVLRVTPNPDNLPLEDRMNRKALSVVIEKDSMPVRFEAVSAYTKAKESPWIHAGVRGVDDGEYIVLDKDSAKIRYPDTPFGTIDHAASFHALQRYQDLFRKLWVGLQQTPPA